LGGWDDNTPKKGIASQIIDFLRHHEGELCDPIDIATGTGAKPDSVRKEICRLLNEPDSLIIKVRHGRYRLKSSNELEKVLERRIRSQQRYFRLRESADYRLAQALKTKERNRLRMENLRIALFAIYGDVCACCGESNKRFLTLDHIASDGFRERLDKSYFNLFEDAILVPDFAKFQILCYNCNMGRAKNGGICPHKDDDVFRRGEGLSSDAASIAQEKDSLNVLTGGIALG
jgi:hypothetical protein